MGQIQKLRGIICGHIHKAENRTIDGNRILQILAIRWRHSSATGPKIMRKLALIYYTSRTSSRSIAQKTPHLKVRPCLNNQPLRGSFFDASGRISSSCNPINSIGNSCLSYRAKGRGPHDQAIAFSKLLTQTRSRTLVGVV